MEDVDGILSDEPIIAFSDAILIYDGKKALQDTMRMIFWHVLRLTARKVGVLRTERLLTYLQIIMDNGTRDLLKFLQTMKMKFLNSNGQMKNSADY